MTDVLERQCRLCAATVPAKSTFCSRCGAAAEKSADADDDEHTYQVRARFAGEIAIDREIGRGAMAVVYLGFDLELERRVAIKVLLPDIAGDPEMADRFKREAKMVAALNHPNVIPIYGLRNSPTISAIIMQLVDGKSLDVVLRERGSSTLPLSVAALILSQVAAGLEHAHARGVVHRDVKPANVLLDPAGHVFVSDFGIARWHGGVSGTGSGVLLGTASYMSPEQCLGRRAEAASDQYAFGVLAFEVLAGRRPFAGRMSELLSAHINDPPPSLSDFRPDLSPEVESFVMRTLEKDPAARHPNLGEAERFFRRLVGDAHAATTQLVNVSLPQPMQAARAAGEVVESSTRKMNTDQPPSRRGRRSLGFALAGAAVIAVVLVAGALMLRPAPRVAEKSAPSVASEVPPVARAADRLRTTAPAESSSKNVIRIPDRPGRPAGAPGVAAQLPQQTPPAATVATEPAIKPASDTVPHADTVRARPQGEVQSKVSVAPPQPTPPVAPSSADARAVASEFLTWCNHRQWRDVERLSSLEGSADLRAELVRLIRSAPDFQAGFERLASRPALSDRTFTTEFVLDLEWRGGQRLLDVTVSAELSNGSWQLAGFGVRSPDSSTQATTQNVDE